MLTGHRRVAVPTRAVERVGRNLSARPLLDLHMIMPRLRDMADVYGTSQRLMQT